MDENKNSSRKIRMRFIGVVVLGVTVLFLCSLMVRRNEHVVVDTVSDFYLSFLDGEETTDVLFVTDRFREILISPNLLEKVMCGSSLPTEVRVGRGAAFWNDGLVAVTMTEATTSWEALVTLKKMSGEWRIDTIACSK